MRFLFAAALLTTLASAEVLNGFFYITDHKNGLYATATNTTEGDVVKFVENDRNYWRIDNISDGLHPWHVLSDQTKSRFPPDRLVTAQIWFPEYKDGAVARLESNSVSLFEVNTANDALFMLVSTDSPAPHPSERLAWTVETLSREEPIRVLKLRRYEGKTNQRFNLVKRTEPECFEKNC
ncbi:predicted protein [Uncinocarpus reesii 1704]|uniref:Uncharacterized protein n=1 Tax=Uncinocarpus reesii (strain UAMH 1704) TaxID=336963 RepID=C4JEZ9_UNCRE|nr:uncharacterized protein UREG_00900 [Uncinocarpus reesii 1704]EEP76052.1 predicted protein [Uncinocarpus reesii 1704]